MATKNGYRSMQFVGYKSPESRIFLQLTTNSYYPSTINHRSFGRSHFPHAHMSTSFRLESLNLPGRITMTFDLLLIHLEFVFTYSKNLYLQLQLSVDP
jgi:hypothetical protein